MTVIRWILGQIILLLDVLTSPKSVVRTPAAQQAVDEVTASMSMYQFKTCPFCVKVRRQLKRHGRKIELRDANGDADLKAELVREGSRHKVPVLPNERAHNNVQLQFQSNATMADLRQRQHWRSRSTPH